MQPTNSVDIPTWQQRRIELRNRIFASARFRRFAARNPLMRGVSRAKAESLFNLINGFVHSQVVLACVQTGLIERLATGPLLVAEAAVLADMPESAADRLLKAAASIDIAEQLRDGRYMLGTQGASLHGSPGLGDMIRHHALLYADLVDPVALLRRGGGGGVLADYWAYDAGRDAAADSVAPYSALMAATQAMVAEQVLGAYDFGKHQRLLDVGGGSGVFVRAVSAAFPKLETAVFDLPAVAARTTGGVAAHGGNFFQDSLPIGFDCISLVRILHDHDDEPAMRLLRNIAAALPPRGTLILAEPMAGSASARAMGDGYFGMYLWAMGQGRPRSPREITQMLRVVGLGDTQIQRTDLPLVTSVIRAGHTKA